MPITLTYPEGGMLVVGGTGRVGEGIVRRLADAGVPLVFTYRSGRDKAEALARALCDEGAQVSAFPIDLTDTASVKTAVDEAVKRCGGIHGIAIGAGAQVPFNNIADFAVEDVARFVNQDSLGHFRVFSAAVPVLRERGGGSITTCTTMATRRVIAYDGLSPFSKGSVDALVRYTAAEEAEHRIRCNAVAIGWVEDRSLEEIQRETPPVPETVTTEMDRVTVLMNQLIDQRRGHGPVTGEQAGTTYAFLASDQARHLTGQTLDLDAGVLL